MNYKALITPFIGVISITVQLVFGIELDLDVQNQVIEVIVNAIAVGMVISGILKNNKE